MVIRSGRALAVWLLLIVVLAPVALASDTTSDASLWAEFVAWLVSMPDSFTEDESGFAAWLMIRPTIPGG